MTEWERDRISQVRSELEMILVEIGQGDEESWALWKQEMERGVAQRAEHGALEYVRRARHRIAQRRVAVGEALEMKIVEPPPKKRARRRVKVKVKRKWVRKVKQQPEGEEMAYGHSLGS